MLGNSFSVVSLWPPRLKFLFQHVLKDTGTEAHCKGLHFLTEDEDLETVGSEDNIITQLQACQYVPMQIIRDKCEQIFDEGEADTIVLGCTCMAGMYPVLKADGLAVLEPMRAGYCSDRATVEGWVLGASFIVAPVSRQFSRRIGDQ